MLYVIGYIQKSNLICKIGVGKNPIQRLRQLQTGSPNKLILLEVFSHNDKNYFKLEKKIHKHLKNYKVLNEWFSFVDYLQFEEFLICIETKYNLKAEPQIARKQNKKRINDFKKITNKQNFRKLNADEIKAINLIEKYVENIEDYTTYSSQYNLNRIPYDILYELITAKNTLKVENILEDLANVHAFIIKDSFNELNTFVININYRYYYRNTLTQKWFAIQ